MNIRHAGIRTERAAALRPDAYAVDLRAREVRADAFRGAWRSLFGRGR